MASYAHPSSSASSGRVYHVFLNFRGVDTRKKFTGHLYSALHSKGVRTFKDSEELHIGRKIEPALYTAIQQSSISIPIFSKDYASSKYCLQELTKILHCYKTSYQIVLPIFLDIEPSEVRNQTGSFREAFQKHNKDFKPEIVDEWREALREVGKLKGWVLKEVENGDESKLVQLVVERVLSELNDTPWIVAKYPIGIDSRVEYILSLLSVESPDPQLVGICGMGGIGKTTLAKAVYNRIFKKFYGSSFLSDIREQASKDRGLTCLQQQLLNDILGKQNNSLRHVDEGSKVIEERLQEKKVLVILDDVDHRIQLNALAGELSWFGHGSRIIITTRDEQVLKEGQVNNNRIYKPEGLDDNQSLQLFSMHAFRRDRPLEDYIQLSRKVVSYAGGLPLTLEVLGSFLGGMRGKKEWESTLHKLNEFPHKEVQKTLKISYDALDDNEKAIFLDIACFFIGMDKEIAMYIWKGCGFYPDIELNVLIRKSLIRIDDNNELRMHDQLRDMGRRIVCEQSPKEPEKRSRLWSREEVIEVLEEHKGTRKVEGILLDYSMWSDILPYSKGWQKDRFRINDFAMMSKLRLLQVNGVGLKGNIEHLPSSLRWLCWQRCPMKSLSSNFYLKKLVVLDLSDSKFSQAWNNGFENKRFEYLKVLNLSRCFYLAESPNFSGFPRLERLILKQCWALVDLHESIGQLKTLVYLDLTECVKLVRIPRSICMLHSLEELFLTSSVLLDEFEGIMRVMDLQSHSSRPVGPKPISGPPIILKSMGRLKSLVRLDLVGTSIEEIPNAIGLLKNLERLRINYCRRLRSLPELPSSLIYLDAMGCKSLEEVPDLSNLKNLWTLCLKDCRRLAKILGLEGVESLNDLDVTGCVTLTNTMRKVLVQDVFNSQSFSFCESYRIGDEEINNKEMSLCLVFELEEEVQYALVNGILDIKACIHRDGKRINCLSDLQINGIQMNRREITYIYHFQGLNWFAFPLKSKDEIVIEEIEWNGISPPSKLKHFGLSLKDRERIQQPVIPHSFADMVKDVYNWLNDTFFRTTG